MKVYKRFGFLITMSMILGFLIMAFVSLSIIKRNAHLDFFSASLIYLAHVSIVYMVLKLCMKLPYRMIEVHTVFLLYCSVVLVITFWRRNYIGFQKDFFMNLQYDRYLGLNPLSFIEDGNVSLNILNLVLFFPMPILLAMCFPTMKTKKSLCIGLSAMLVIEVMQAVTNLGSFDVGDIVLYIGGYLLGILATRFIKRFAIIERT